jgi:hypothetical protein
MTSPSRIVGAGPLYSSWTSARIAAAFSAAASAVSLSGYVAIIKPEFGLVWAAFHFVTPNANEAGIHLFFISAIILSVMGDPLTIVMRP